ncbi:MAG: hypothetical protein GXN96_05975 [Aquificae bacterium]|nr:hypothetical protein [Aquificota bacterium]
MKALVGILLAGSLALTPQEAVERYLSGLEKALNTGRALYVRDAATEKLVTRLQVWLDAWYFPGYRIEAKLVDFNIEKESLSEAHGVIVTTERWTYRYLYRDTGEEALPLQKITYKIEYWLRRESSGGWRVYRINILKEVKGWQP